MEFEELVYKRRTIRRFKSEPVSIDILKKLVDFGRVAPSASNVQAVEYIIVTNEDTRRDIFKQIRWAGSLALEDRVPEEGRRPMAYIIVLLNTDIKKSSECDLSAAIQNILLGALNEGLGACWMGAIDRNEIHSLLKVPKKYNIGYVVSLGYPDEVSEIVECKYSNKDSYKYWKDEDGKMHIPKLSLKDVIHKIID